MALRPVQFAKKAPSGGFAQWLGLLPPCSPHESGASVPAMDSKLDMEEEPNSEVKTECAPTPRSPLGADTPGGSAGLNVCACVQGSNTTVVQFHAPTPAW
jgi:hypothetical protein